MPIALICALKKDRNDMNNLRGVSLAEWLLFLGVIAVACSLAYVKGRYDERGTMSLPDSSVTITQEPQKPITGVAKPVKKPARIKPSVQPKPDVHVSVNSPDSVTISRADLDSLRADRTFEIKEEGLGTLTFWYAPTLKPSEEFPAFYWQPEPVKVTTIEIVREREPALTEKLEWGMYGAGVAAVLILLLR